MTDANRKVRDTVQEILRRAKNWVTYLEYDYLMPKLVIFVTLSTRSLENKGL